ncbi:LOW QUALITY PROTEIN: hypothetical protein PHMEG_0005379 [Phytophthora megakarya]|uniref:Uncharacterized protein n=1 Tax=Phytophthora megakarya TaxID=4795 RepID=A0A225WTI7_9STRA|nr:LOW QUALITY PROTEIN: hypothetical protein PHMEG_0005379 [Phytophthora megakarya]
MDSGLIAFLDGGALALDEQLQATANGSSLRHEKGYLNAKGALKSTHEPGSNTLVPVIPLTFIETVLHYCHVGPFSSQSDTMKTVDKV